MDLFLRVGSPNTNLTRKNTQSPSSKHSSTLFISNSKPSVPVVQVVSDKARVSTKTTAPMQSLPITRRTRRVTIRGPDAQQMNSTHSSAQECAPARLNSPASAAASNSWKTFQSRQRRPRHPPTSWKGPWEDYSDYEDSAPETWCDECRHANSEATDDITSSETRSGSSLSAVKPFNRSAFPVCGTEHKMLPDRTVWDNLLISETAPDPPRSSRCISEASVGDKGTRRRLRPTTRETKTPVLPDPEIAYGQEFYYTTCPHASPPCSRPLNVQPVLMKYQAGLLRYAPFHLRVHPLEPAPEIFILEGSCSQCDLAARREAELRVLSKYKSKIDVLSNRLYELRGEVDLDSPTLPRECYSGISQPINTQDTMADNTGIVFTPEVIEQILSLEADLELIVKRRDREVKFVWRGYTARWGPATLGVFHPVTLATQQAATSNAESALSQSSNTSDTESSVSCRTKSSHGRPKYSAFTDSSSATSYSDGTGATTTSSTRRQHGYAPRSTSASPCDTPRARYSNGRHNIPLPLSIDGTHQEGRMRINWVRRDPVRTPRR